MKLFIVDAFTKQAFGGNPAGVVLLPAGRDFPDVRLMQQIAAELRYSETAFVKRLADDVFNIRYFTPVAEVDLCGHATIAAFYVLLDQKVVVQGQTYRNQTRAGTLNIAVGETVILMDMAEPKMFEAITAEADLDRLYQTMGLSRLEQGTYRDATFLPRLVSTGLIDIMLPVKDEAQLNAITPDFKALAKLSEHYGVVGVHAFTVNSGDGKVHARNFAPLYDINEEAATGTSNGALAYYLYQYQYLAAGDLLAVVQGEKIGRPSQISAQVVVEKGCEKVKVGGKAVILAEGHLRGYAASIGNLDSTDK